MPIQKFPADVNVATAVFEVYSVRLCAHFTFISHAHALVIPTIKPALPLVHVVMFVKYADESAETVLCR